MLSLVYKYIRLFGDQLKREYEFRKRFNKTKEKSN